MWTTLVHLPAAAVCSDCFVEIAAWTHANLTHIGGGQYKVTHTKCPELEEHHDAL